PCASCRRQLLANAAIAASRVGRRRRRASTSKSSWFHSPDEREAEARLRTRDDMAVDQSLETGVALSLLLPASCENVVEPVREGIELRLGELARAIGREPKALFGCHHSENLARALDDVSRDRFRDRGPLDRRALTRLGGAVRLFRLGSGPARA